MPTPSPAPPTVAAPSSRTDTPAEATGRRILSTAFVRLGPGERLTVELADGQTVVLRDVVMRADAFCGAQVDGGKYCGSYAAVSAARPGGPASDDTRLPTVEPARGPAEPR